MLGSFVIGFINAPAALGRRSPKTVAILPLRHPWQEHLALQVGLRTGFCGSLTTFGSWVESLFHRAVWSNAWAEAFSGVVVGLAASLGCYVVGCHAAAAVFDRLERAEQSALGRGDGASEKRDRISAALETELQAAQRELVAEEPDLPPREVLEDVEQGEQAALRGRPSGGVDKVGTIQAPIEAGRLSASRSAPQLSSPTLKSSSSASPPAPPGPPPASFAFAAVDWLAALALLLTTAGAGVGVGLELSQEWLRVIWLSVLLGPLGCWLRWFLARRLNQRLAGSWAWVPAGTLAANALGTAVTASMANLLDVASLGAAGTLCTQAVQSGFTGALTTVSTFVLEVRAMEKTGGPGRRRAYLYATGSLLLAIFLCIVIMGPARWGTHSGEVAEN